jgi:hypothetical protein
MNFTYRMSHVGDEYTAECLEFEAMGVGKTGDAAIESLRKLLAERVLRPDAVAPPSHPDVEESIELRPTLSSSTQSTSGEL